MRLLWLPLLLAGADPAPAEPKYTDYHEYEYSLPGWGDRFQFAAGSAKDRCSLRDCLCRVGPPVGEPAGDRIKKISRRQAVYFDEGSYALRSADKSSLGKWLKLVNKKASITLVGYTDDCGTHEYNQRLVKDRIDTVRDEMRRQGYTGVKSIVFKAESSFGHDPSSMRVDVIVHEARRLTTMVDKVQADVYLIDASGSMWEGWKKWSDIVAVSFKPNSKIYLSKTSSCTRGTPLDRVTPGGGTEIWYSYWKVIDHMKTGETLAIISDFESKVPLTRREAQMIEAKVRAKGIKVIVIKP